MPDPSRRIPDTYLKQTTYALEGQLFIALVASKMCSLPCALHTHMLIGLHKNNGRTVILDSFAKIPGARLTSHLATFYKDNVYNDFENSQMYQPETIHTYKAYSLTYEQLLKLQALTDTVPRQYFTKQAKSEAKDQEEWQLTETTIYSGVDNQKIKRETGNDPSYFSPCNTCRDSMTALLRYTLGQNNVGHIPACIRSFHNTTGFGPQELQHYGDYFYILPPLPKQDLKQRNIIQYTVLTKLFSHLEYLAKENAHKKFDTLKTLYIRILENPLTLEEKDFSKEELNTHRNFWHLPFSNTRSYKITTEAISTISALKNIPKYRAALHSQKTKEILVSVFTGILCLGAIGLSCLSFGIAPSVVLGAALTTTLAQASVVTAAAALVACTASNLFQLNQTREQIHCAKMQICLAV